jgi:RNA polymerase sigma-70 factor (ECF subfamily)
MLKRALKNTTATDGHRDAAGASDAAIIGRVLEGDLDAFGDLMMRYEAMVVTRVKYHVPPDALEETVQEVFLKAYKSLATCRERDRFKAWLSSIAVKTCYDQLRGHYRRKETALSTLSDDHQSWLEFMLADQSREAYERQLNQKEARETLEWALSKLPPKDRMTLELVHLQGHSVKEAAQLLGWSTANVKVRAHRSRKKLKALLEGLMGEADEVR